MRWLADRSVGVALSLRRVAAILPLLLVLVPLGGGSTAAAATPVTSLIQLGAGNAFGCALLSDGNVDCWGRGDDGELGNGALAVNILPGPVSIDGGAVQLSASGNTACTRQSDGHVDCWGSGYQGILGNGGTTDAATPVEVSGLSSATDISVGASSACAVVSGGGVDCWGSNAFGQLGDGSTESGSDSPVPVNGITSAVAVAVGSDAACAVLDDGTVQCWGNNSNGQLGVGTLATSESATPVAIASFGSVRSIASAGQSFCAVRTDGSVQCWGDNSYGQLGSGTTAPALSPAGVVGLSGPVASLSMGYATGSGLGAQASSTCALLVSGTVQCWGSNANDTLGVASTTLSESLTARAVAIGAQPVSAVMTSGNQSCAVVSDGTLHCWGSEIVFGSVPTPTPKVLGPFPDLPFAPTLASQTTTSGQVVAQWTPSASVSGSTPTGFVATGTFQGAPSIVQISVGFTSSCAVLSDGTVACWGDNGTVSWGDNGTQESGGPGDHLGNPYSAISPTPVLVPGLANVTQVAVGNDYACALELSGAVACWGQDEVGQLGNGVEDYQHAYLPTEVPGLSNVVQLSNGSAGPCALLSTGHVECWGAAPQVANPGSFEAVASPTLVPGINSAQQIAGGFLSDCALLVDGSVECWGDNAGGQLGDGTSSNSSTPVVVSGLGGVVSVQGTDGASFCALEDDGSVQCWGENLAGELGNGTTTTSLTPTPVVGAPSLTQLAGSNEGMCGIDTGAQVWCWGAAANLQSGLGSPTPVEIPGVSGALSVSSGYEVSCAVVTSGPAICWGANRSGELGNGSLSTNVEVTTMTPSISSLCESSLSSCAMADPPGSSSVSTTVQSVSSDGASVPSAALSGAVTGSDVVTQMSNTVLAVSFGQTIVLSAQVSDPSAVVSYQTSTPYCQIAGNVLTATQPVSCVVSAVVEPVAGPAPSTTPAPTRGPLLSDAPAATVAGPRAFSTRTRFLFLGAAQSPLSLTAPTTSVVGGAVSLAVAGGSGSGRVVYSVTGSGCFLNNGTLLASSTTTCSVVAKKFGDAVYRSASSAPVSFQFSGRQAQAAFALTVQQPTGGVLTMSLGVTGGSGTGSVSYFTPSANCSIQGAVLRATTSTDCTVEAVRGSDASYFAAKSSPVTYVFAAAPTLQPQNQLEVAPLQGSTGKALTLVAGGGSGSGGLTFELLMGSAPSCALNGNRLTNSKPGNCRVEVTKAGDSRYTSATSPARLITFRSPPLPPTMTLSFKGTTATLTAHEQQLLKALVSKLMPGAALKVTGFARGNALLARARALVVSRFLQKRLHCNVALFDVVSRAVNQVTVKTLLA